jgi:hypothetical protein
MLILSHSTTDIVPLGCSASGRICSRGVELFVCVVSKTCELSLILPCVTQMINDNLNNEVTCILEKQIIFLTRVTVKYMGDSFNSINGMKSLQYFFIYIFSSLSLFFTMAPNLLETN